jgi:CTP:molybdopterin cytidylyltransferase MocA
MPGVPVAVYRVLLEWSERLGSDFPYALIPKFGGKKGHPLLLHSAMRERILHAEPSETMREVLAEVPTMIVPVTEPGILQDIDTAADYRNQRQSETEGEQG